MIDNLPLQAFSRLQLNTISTLLDRGRNLCASAIRTMLVISAMPRLSISEYQDIFAIDEYFQGYVADTDPRYDVHNLVLLPVDDMRDALSYHAGRVADMRTLLGALRVLRDNGLISDFGYLHYDYRNIVVYLPDDYIARTDDCIRNKYVSISDNFLRQILHGRHSVSALRGILYFVRRSASTGGNSVNKRLPRTSIVQSLRDILSPHARPCHVRNVLTSISDYIVHTADHITLRYDSTTEKSVLQNQMGAVYRNLAYAYEYAYTRTIPDADIPYYAEFAGRDLQQIQTSHGWLFDRQHTVPAIVPTPDSHDFITTNVISYGVRRVVDALIHICSSPAIAHTLRTANPGERNTLLSRQIAYHCRRAICRMA